MRANACAVSSVEDYESQTVLVRKNDQSSIQLCESERSMYRHKCIINRLRIFNISQHTHTMHNWGIANLIVWTSQIRCRCSSRRCFSVRGLKMIVAHNYGSKCNLDRLCCRFCIASPFVVADIKVVATAATVVMAAETVENSCWLPQLFFHCRSRLSVSIRQSSVSSPQPTPVL